MSTASARLDEAVPHTRTKARKGSRPPIKGIKDNEVEVVADDVADWVNAPSSRISQLGRENEIPRNKRGKYPLRSAIRSYCEWFRDEARRNTKGALASEVAVAKADHLKLDLALKQEQLMGVADACDLFDEGYGAIKSSILAVPARLTGDVTLRKKIEDALNEAFDSAIHSFAQLREAQAASED